MSGSEATTASPRRKRTGRTGRPHAAERPPGFTRESLLRSAAEVFAERGFEKASLQEIAARADVTSAAIYRHFDNKADLLFKVVKQALHAAPSAEGLAREGVGVPTRVADAVAVYAAPELASLRRLAVELHAAASRDEEMGALLREYNEQFRGALSATLANGVEAGQMPRDLDADRVASLLLVVIMGLAHLETLEPTLIGDETWRGFLDSCLGDLLLRSTWRAP